MTTPVVTLPPPSVTTIDGETRPVTTTWPDGSWDCPFCGGVCDPSGQYYKLRSWPGPCASPACIVGGAGTAERVAQIRLARQQAEEASSQRAWLHRFNEQQAASREEARHEAVEAFTAEARKHGFCVECWGRSTQWGLWLSQAKKVKHRKPENCPSVRRRKP